ncbi:transcriptional regulator [Xanthomonas arboricola]|uniref:winged helix-turn-helix domain-containing protein n=1 Tax=Xanthomonas arboricola TaxID=56448 RepID=UPI000CEE8A10|nr:helix-turn-helix domain-containing protein [Xanthomonas arboricola]PPT72756.1 transcriptional regulator [Xanthomonas arboricola]
MHTSPRRLISRPEQVRLLSSPARQEIVDTLASLGGAASTAELAEQLGRPADGLYYHLRELVAGDLLTEVMEVGGERVFRLAGEGAGPARLVYNLGPHGNANELARFARSLLQVAQQDFEAAIEVEEVVTAGKKRELWVSRNKGWLSDRDLQEVNVLLERLSELTSQPKAEGRNRLASLAFALAPTKAQPKRRGTQGASPSK